MVKQNVLGTVVGQSATDPGGRVTIAFARREDGRSNNLTLKLKNPAGVGLGERVDGLLGMCFFFFWGGGLGGVGGAIVQWLRIGGSFNT